MMYILENDTLRVKVSSLGAELQSIRRTDKDVEYLWQGDNAYWARRASNLFPVCGRLAGGGYTYRGKRYELGSHGFARNMEWSVLHQKADSLTLQLTSNEETLAAYPFPFAVEMTYALSEDRLSVTTIVHNKGEESMPFAVGGHPGFNVPLTEGETFDDYVLEFDEVCQPLAFELAENCFFTGKMKALTLEEGCRLPLRHSLFDEDAIFVKDAAKGVTLRSTISEHSLHVAYPDYPYVGFWHCPKTEAPFVCIEPWTMGPSAENHWEDLEQKADMIHLDGGAVHRVNYTITVK